MAKKRAHGRIPCAARGEHSGPVPAEAEAGNWQTSSRAARIWHLSERHLRTTALLLVQTHNHECHETSMHAMKDATVWEACPH
eukprot:scaffold3472_cov136-Isochrysis_galbana.AAC.3